MVPLTYIYIYIYACVYIYIYIYICIYMRPRYMGHVMITEEEVTSIIRQALDK